MPQCKNCHREISKFDNDVCPYCGTVHPIDDNYKTKDMTQFVDPVSGNYQLYKSKTKKTTVLLAVFLGWVGAHFFYLGYTKKAWLAILGSLFIIGGIGSLLCFLPTGLSYSAYLIAFAAAWLPYPAIAAKYAKSDTYKDANGEFLR
jgi:TM2 domain-containing membrane protein YozV